MTTTTYQDIIEPIVTERYGSRMLAKALVSQLVLIAESYDPMSDHRTREDRIMLACWNMYPGGATAAAVAKRIEEALNGA